MYLNGQIVKQAKFKTVGKRQMSSEQDCVSLSALAISHVFGTTRRMRRDNSCESALRGRNVPLAVKSFKCL